MGRWLKRESRPTMASTSVTSSLLMVSKASLRLKARWPLPRSSTTSLTWPWMTSRSPACSAKSCSGRLNSVAPRLTWSTCRPLPPLRLASLMLLPITGELCGTRSSVMKVRSRRGPSSLERVSRSGSRRLPSVSM